MKRTIIGICFLIASVVAAQAHLPIPPSGFFKTADKIYLAEVTSSQGRKVTFGISDVLRGTSTNQLALTLHEDEQESFAVGTKWLLIREPDGKPNVLGESFDGPDGEWIPGPITIYLHAPYVETYASPSSGMKLTKLPDGHDGVSLDEVKSYLESHPFKR